MEQKIYEILLKMQSTMGEMNERLTKVEEMSGKLTKVEEMSERLKRVEETVNRIEYAQTEDVVGMLKSNKKTVDFEADYLNKKLTDMDKRIYILEKKVEN
ncbi:hypothetical protein SAMN05421736_116127 [Evansella caseinilytica]|uniref:Uncharacterized protein n=1 Tax=Evansella caseinilytica TaxID=1503961 RepID=A0A1H3TXC2_9BACI|nr:hypothetical protein [Evansella caseinilytica]SDZ54856.1 hypothetical protein SAMN05421736_116127 [Evansella caseinilytica]